MPKRTKAPRRKTRERGGEAGARYAALKAQWDERRLDSNYAGAGDYLVDKPELALDAAPFLRTLTALGAITQNRQFPDLRAWLMRSGLIDLATGHWSRYGTTLAHPLTREICEQAAETIAGGTSERLAIAEAVAAYVLPGHSFVAACQNFKRVLDAWREHR